jgi:phytoene desaturase
MSRQHATVIGSGIGGIACAIRLQSLGFNTQIVEQLGDVGGRAYVRREQDFVFDMGPTVLTVPHFIEELFSLERDHAMLHEPDFPPAVLEGGNRITSGISGGANTSRYLDIVPILPFYRIYFDDGTFFDYDADPENVRAQIAQLAPVDLDGYERFHEAARAIFQRGFLELGYTHFGSIGSMVSVLPDLLRLGAIQPLFSLISKYFKSDKMRQVFSFEPLLIGGNPLKVPAPRPHRRSQPMSGRFRGRTSVRRRRAQPKRGRPRRSGDTSSISAGRTEWQGATIRPPPRSCASN